MISKVSITDQIVDFLMLYIDQHNLSKDMKMPTEKEVCEMMGVGRSSVREAYKALQARGIVVSVQGKGVFVCKDTQAGVDKENPFFDKQMSIRDYIDVRSSIETAAVRFAIQRATPEQIEELRAIHASFVKSIEQNNVSKMASYDELFHMRITEITNNPMLIQMEEIVNKNFRPFRLRSFQEHCNTVHAVNPHAMIIEAFAQKNEELGVLMITQHLKLSFEDMEGIIQAAAEKERREPAQ